MTQPTVTQEDRDATARLHGYANWAVWESVPHHEAAWMQLCAKDFARHREAAEKRGMRRAAKIAYIKCMETRHLTLADTIARAIREAGE